jgi:hypothetical protein
MNTVGIRYAWSTLTRSDDLMVLRAVSDESQNKMAAGRAAVSHDE